MANGSLGSQRCFLGGHFRKLKGVHSIAWLLKPTIPAVDVHGPAHAVCAQGAEPLSIVGVLLLPALRSLNSFGAEVVLLNLNFVQQAQGAKDPGNEQPSVAERKHLPGGGAQLCNELARLLAVLLELKLCKD
eukprot:CAMPEP_0168387152 /NCGR_PEP_ID=MMETSP0228-20121227/15797_1 /TAXON_ID=133427 /ORGANISM="Protoceratium reticulatum, Strain CCCM 535 (=CCMP 1889)" /LENGTH=131 /DNA_ID=CAMNT_0008400377 /DNA_START=493 /DNA_END=888 /DNA_ORIENTATION=+